MVYVLDNAGQPLMPTSDYRKVRLLLKHEKAKVVKRTPFTIQMLVNTTHYTQPLTLGVDAGSKTIGLSVCSETTEVYSSEVELRSDITKLLSARRELRRTRRNRKTRYRKPRFLNRKRQKGWLAPSVSNKIATHLKVIENLHQILPITTVRVEVASFDIQKIKHPDISGIDYQKGERLGFWNVREYVLFRDGHQCQCCKGKSGDKILNVHHIESRQTGGDAPNNLITLCETCHKGYHAGTVTLPPNIRRGMSFKDAAFMGIMRWALYASLKELYPDVHLTYGYLTKNLRISHNLPKEHRVDARCIAGYPDVQPAEEWFFSRKLRRHNRQIHKLTIMKGGVRKRNQAVFEIFGFRLFDTVRFNGTDCFISGRRTRGYFKLVKLDGTVVHTDAPYKQIKLLGHNRGFLTERRPA